MTTMVWERDADPAWFDGRRVAVIGYGSQGRAHALNLRDSGVDVVVGLREGGHSWQQATTDGFTAKTVAEAARQADVIAMLIPDMAQRQSYREDIAPNLKAGAALLFAHGFNVRYDRIQAPQGHDVILVAPKGPGTLVRRQYEAGRGVPCLFAVEQDASGEAKRTALAYAHHIGGTRAGVIETTFAEETETDLFGEQAVLCGGATELVVAGFETLCAAGYQPEIAYFECLHELKLIVDLLYEGGLEKLHTFVSDTAKFGDLTRGPRIIDASVRERMKQVLDEIRDGRFAREWLDEYAHGMKNYRALLEADLEQPIEAVGKHLRSRMSWISHEADPQRPTPLPSAQER